MLLTHALCLPFVNETNHVLYDLKFSLALPLSILHQIHHQHWSVFETSIFVSFAIALQLHRPLDFERFIFVLGFSLAMMSSF